MKNISVYILSLILLTTLFSCEDYLMEESETSFTTNSLFQTVEGLDKMVVAFYDYERGIVRRGNANGFLAAHLFEERISEEHTSELQSRPHLVCRLLLEKKK